MTSQEVAPSGEVGPDTAFDPAASAEIERAMVRMRRNMTKHSLGALFTGAVSPKVELAQLFVIDAIDEGMEVLGPEVSVGAVAELVGVDLPRASRLVTAAIEAGYVTRVSSPTDARRSNVQLAPAGQELAEQVRRFRQEFYESLMDGWPVEDQRQFAVLFDRFTTALTEATRSRRGAGQPAGGTGRDAAAADRRKPADRPGQVG